MGFPLGDMEAVTEKFCNLWNGVQRHGLKQGINSDGAVIKRCIDNHADNDNNNAASRRQRMPMTSVAYIMLMIRTLAKATADLSPEFKFMGATEHLKHTRTGPQEANP